MARERELLCLLASLACVIANLDSLIGEDAKIFYNGEWQDSNMITYVS